jgi:hypothetical protein
MPQVYEFQIGLAVTDTLPRNRFVNVIHMEHVVGSVLDTDLENVCADLAAMYQSHYAYAGETTVKAYDVGPKPNYPLAQVTVNQGLAYGINVARELALVLSFAGENRGNKSERGRIYLCPNIVSTNLAAAAVRPSTPQQNWALNFFTMSNNSFPDIGGVDWKFGIYSPTYKKFTQAEQAWVNDEWDIIRKRGLRETGRVTAIREG